MLKLLAYRVAPLMLRPLAILLEGQLSGNPTILVLSLPIAMMALMLSSIPVHREYYKSYGAGGQSKRLGRQYIDALMWLLVISYVVLVGVLSIPIFGFAPYFIFIAAMTFGIEKMADESSRILEFRKDYYGWFLMQSFRSGWVFIPLLAAFLGSSYEKFYIISITLTALVSLVVFILVSGFAPSFGWGGFLTIRRNLVFFVGSFLPASYRQFPRIFIVKIYPEQAHAFSALAQFAQGIAILFNVRFQIPYRKIIARKPLTFQRLMEPAMRNILLVPLLVVTVYCAGPIFIDLSQRSVSIQMFFFAPVVVADALVFSIISVHLGYIQWSASRGAAIRFYLLCMIVALFALLLLAVIRYVDLVNLSGIPIATMSIGLVWLIVAKVRFFRGNKKQARELQ